MTTHLDDIFTGDSQLFKALVYDEDGVTPVTPLSCTCSVWNDDTNVQIVTDGVGTVGSGYAQYNWSGSSTAGNYVAILTVTISVGVIKSEEFAIYVSAKPSDDVILGGTNLNQVIRQRFCSVDDLIADVKSAGMDLARTYQAICEASEYLQKKIGRFIPVTETHYFTGRWMVAINPNKTEVLFVPPLLGIASIMNDEDTLTASDYILHPTGGMWANGPYTSILVNPDATQLSAWSAELDSVVINGRWGLYERSGSTGATVADASQQSSSQTTLKVSDGSKVSPAMILLIGSEQEEVTGFGDPTASVTTLNGAVAAGDETITVTNGALINTGEVLRVGFEQIRVLDKQTHTLAVVRGWNGTGRVAHLTGVAVDVYRTVNVERGVNGTTATSHSNGATINRYYAPEDIQILTKEIATLIMNKAKSSYQGRTGNAELGTVFYNDLFPRFDMEEIAKGYYIPRI